MYDLVRVVADPSLPLTEAGRVHMVLLHHVSPFFARHAVRPQEDGGKMETELSAPAYLTSAANSVANNIFVLPGTECIRAEQSVQDYRARNQKSVRVDYISVRVILNITCNVRIRFLALEDLTHDSRFDMVTPKDTDTDLRYCSLHRYAPGGSTAKELLAHSDGPLAVITELGGVSPAAPSGLWVDAAATRYALHDFVDTLHLDLGQKTGRFDLERYCNPRAEWLFNKPGETGASNRKHIIWIVIIQPLLDSLDEF